MNILEHPRPSRLAGSFVATLWNLRVLGAAVFLLSTTSARAQAPLEPASVRVQRQIDARAAESTRQDLPAVFLAVALPRDSAERRTLSGNAVLMIAALGKDPTGLRIHSAHFVDRFGIPTTLDLDRTIVSPPAAEERIRKAFGRNRLNHFYLLPLGAAREGGIIELKFTGGEPVRKEFPPTPMPQYEAVHEGTQETSFATGLHKLAKREFPEFSFPPRVRISQKETQQNSIRQAKPFYPTGAHLGRISGQVTMRAVIGTDGRIQETQLISGHPMLASSALEAVRQWIYRPFLHEGEPCEVETTIVISFYTR